MSTQNTTEVMVGGAVLLTGSDVVGRLVARPSEVDVGIITAVVHIPHLAYEVRFVDENGNTVATATLMPVQVRRWEDNRV